MENMIDIWELKTWTFEEMKKAGDKADTTRDQASEEEFWHLHYMCKKLEEYRRLRT